MEDEKIPLLGGLKFNLSDDKKNIKIDLFKPSTEGNENKESEQFTSFIIPAEKYSKLIGILFVAGSALQKQNAELGYDFSEVEDEDEEGE